MAKITAKEIKELRERNELLEVILEHVNPGLDLETEMDNVAYRKDGTAVYIGDLPQGEATNDETETNLDENTEVDVDAEEKEEEKEKEVETTVSKPVKIAPKKRPAFRRNSQAHQPDLSKMSHKDKVNHYRETMQKEWV